MRKETDLSEKWCESERVDNGDSIGKDVFVASYSVDNGSFLAMMVQVGDKGDSDQQ